MNKKTRYILLIYASVVAVLLCSILMNHRDYQDAWILQDVFIPTIIFVFVFSLVATTVEDNRIVALVCSSFTVILNVIPNLKYQMLYGTYDSIGHFGFAERLLSLGYVPQTGFYSSVYSDFPGMHILISGLSLITGASINVCIKLVTSMLFGAIPLFAYFVTNRVFSKDAQKYILVASGLPIMMSYTIFGTTFGIIFFCSFFYTLFRKYLSKENKRKYTLTLIIIAFGLLFSHAVTMLFLIFSLCFMFISMKFIDFTKKISFHNLSHETIGIITFLSVLFIAWLMFKANFVFEVYIDALQRSFTGETAEALIPERFFEIPLLEQLKIFALKYIKDAVILVLSLAGFFVLLKNFKQKNGHIFKNLYLPLILILSAVVLFLAFQFATGFGEIEYRRFLDYAMLFSPFLAGLFLWHANERLKATFRKKWFSTLLISSILFVCIAISIIQIFPYQPLVPKADVLSKTLPGDEYIIDLRMVNTIYQINMIRFAERFASEDVNITSDKVTRWQIFGLANEDFSSRHIYHSPLKPEESTRIRRWNLFLLHYGGRSGPLGEKVEYRNKEVINKLKNTLGNNVYDNGESFIIWRCFDFLSIYT